MKNKISFSQITRWVFAPLLVGGLLAWSVSPAYSGNDKKSDTSRAAAKQAVSSVSVKASSESHADVLEIKARISELEANERQNYVMVLEGQRKTMDWWFSFLAVLTALMAIFGALIPFLMARKDKEMIQHDKEQIRKMLDTVKGLKVDAEGEVEKIHQLSETLKDFQSGKQTDEADSKISAAVATVEQDKNADTPLRLRAEAISASQAKDAAKAYALWNALIVLVPSDVGAQMNAGYWAQVLGENAQGVEKPQWLQVACKHYAQALTIKSDIHVAAYNWGNALAAEARAILVQDLERARSLLKQAGEKYQQALRIKSDTHEAANNWGIALHDEARAVLPQDLAGACSLWKQAGEKYQQALSIKPDKYDSAYNWGNALDAEARAISDQDITNARVLWKRAGEKYQQALTLNSDMHKAACNWGNALGVEARAILAQDLSGACALWELAGEKYEQALRIDPELHEVVGNWGGALISEANALSTIDQDEFKVLLDKAEKLLIAHASAAPEVVAYNLACIYGLRGDALQCLHWLKVSRSHNTFPGCSHLRKDRDLDAVRNSPEFIAWLATVCDDKEVQNLNKDK